MEIYLIRHTAVDVPFGTMYGQTDVGLTSTFEEEADQVKEQLKGQTFDAVYSSPLSRCVRLCNHCGYPDAVKDDRIKELNFGEWEMKTFQELTTDERSKAWFEDWINYRIPGGESFTDQYIRVSEFLDMLKTTGYRKVAVFAHGGVITLARVYAGLYKKEEAFANLPNYGEVISITI